MPLEAEVPVTGPKGDTVEDVFTHLFDDADKPDSDGDDGLSEKDSKKTTKKLAPKVDDGNEEDLDADSDDDGEEDSDEDKDEEKEEPDELDELNVEDDEEYHDVPNRAKVLEKYPKIFKDFPGIQRAMYREAEYTKVFPSIKDAQVAKNNLETFNNLQGQIFEQGSITELLGAVKQADEKTFKKLTGNIVDSIQKLDNDSYLNIAGLLIRRGLHTVKSAAGKMGKNPAKKEDADQLELAAQIVNEYLFGDSDISLPDANQPKGEETKPYEISKREREFNQRQLQTAVQDVTDKVTGRIKDVVTQAIDPKEMMTPYVRSTAIKDVMDKINKVIQNDFRFRNHLDNLWKASRDANFTEESKGRIRLAILNRAKTDLRDIVKQVRADAVKGQSRNSSRSSGDVRKEKFRGNSDSSTSKSSNNERQSSGGKLQGKTTMEKLFGSGD